MKAGEKRLNYTYKNSDDYRKKAHQLIPGGCHTYSKGDDQFPKIAPAAISKGKGAYVWDIDGNRFLDCSMGLTSVSLGHAFEPVIEKVKEQLGLGSSFQRPASIELEMAEKFLSLIPQHQMIKFAKTGSIITTAAVKLARAFTKRKMIALPSDHPFFSYDDWFIGTTPCDKGVPEEFKSLIVTFKSCDINSLELVFKKYPNQIACVITEPEKSHCNNGCNCKKPVNKFLEEAIKLTHLNNSLFILDEMVTGFKTHLPGSIVKYKLQADLACWGKSIANGFSFCALTGKKEIMSLGGINNPGTERVFLISTTFGGETGPIAASIATLNFFKNHDVIKKNQTTGNYLISECIKALNNSNLNDYITIYPCNWMITFVFKNSKHEICSGMRTLFLQEMISNGILFQGIFIPCFSHSKKEIDFFISGFVKALKTYKKAIENGYEQFLIGEPIKPVFRKFN